MRKIREGSKRRRSEDIRSIVEKKMEYFYTEGIQKNERGDVKDDGNGIELLILLLRSTPMGSGEGVGLRQVVFETGSVGRRVKRSGQCVSYFSSLS